MAASMNAVVDVDDQMVYPTRRSISELSMLKELTLDSMTLMEECTAGLTRKIFEFQTELDTVRGQLADVTKTIAELNTGREERVDVLPSTPVSATCSSGMGNLNFAELHEQKQQQEIKPKNRRIRHTTIKQPNTRSLESNQTKRPIASKTRAKSNKMHEVKKSEEEYDVETNFKKENKEAKN